MLCQGLLMAFQILLKHTMEDAVRKTVVAEGVRYKAIVAVEILGGGSRIQIVQNAIQEVVGKVCIICLWVRKTLCLFECCIIQYSYIHACIQVTIVTFIFVRIWFGCEI